MRSFRQHLSDNKGLYLAGGLTLGALAAAYYMRKSGGVANDRKQDYFPTEYLNEAGISKDLSNTLGRAFKGAIDYDLKLWLQPKQDRFKGLADITFMLDPEFKEDIYLSIQGLTVYQIRINGRKVDSAYLDEICESQQGSLYIANRHINAESFRITIKYSGEFGSTYGLINYQDPRSESGESYVFSSTNILGASAIYPVFESQEVRCMFRLAVSSPKDWKVISNEKADDPLELKDEFGKLAYEKDPLKEDFHLFKFRQTKAIPFNALNIAAGKLAEFKTTTSVLGRKVNVYGVDSEKQKLGKISEHLGKIVKSTVSRMEKISGIKYPFTKCDILILPEDLIFPAIFALNPIKLNKEFPGLTTVYLRDYHNFTAEFVFEAVTAIVRLWFGTLVSPRWWSHLWLTEAFSRYIAFRIMKEDPQDYNLTDENIHHLNFYLKSQAIYHESQNDVTFTNQSLVQDDIVNSFDALFLAQNKSEKVGMFKIEELFSFYPDEAFESVVADLAKNYSWKSMNYQDFKLSFSKETVKDPHHLNNLSGCFEYKFIDEIKFSRTSEDTLTVQRITKENSAPKNHLIEIIFLSKQGTLIKRETAVLEDKSTQFKIDSEVYTFLSVLRNNGVFYEMYDKEEIGRLFEILHDNKNMEADYRLKVARVLLTNTLKAKSLNLREALGHIRTLLDNCVKEEQKWLVRSFSVITKHIDRNRETATPIRDFCVYLISLARSNYDLVPYLGYFGCFDHSCKEAVCEFVQDYDSVVKNDPTSSIINYDLLKSSLLMITFLRTDIDKVVLFPKLVATTDRATGYILERMVEHHIEDLATEHIKITQDLKRIFLKKPTYSNSLEYYFNSMLIRTETSDEMKAVRKYLTEVNEKPDDHYVGGKKTFIYYNIAKMLSAATRDESKLEEEMDLSPGVDAMVARRFKHHFKLA